MPLRYPSRHRGRGRPSASRSSATSRPAGRRVHLHGYVGKEGEVPAAPRRAWLHVTASSAEGGPWRSPRPPPLRHPQCRHRGGRPHRVDPGAGRPACWPTTPRSSETVGTSSPTRWRVRLGRAAFEHSKALSWDRTASRARFSPARGRATRGRRPRSTSRTARPPRRGARVVAQNTLWPVLTLGAGAGAGSRPRELVAWGPTVFLPPRYYQFAIGHEARRHGGLLPGPARRVLVLAIRRWPPCAVPRSPRAWTDPHGARRSRCRPDACGWCLAPARSVERRRRVLVRGLVWEAAAALVTRRCSVAAALPRWARRQRSAARPRIRCIPPPEGS